MMTNLCINYLNVLKSKYEKNGLAFETEGDVAFLSSVTENRNTLNSFGVGFLRVHHEREKKKQEIICSFECLWPKNFTVFSASRLITYR